MENFIIKIHFKNKFVLICVESEDAVRMFLGSYDNKIDKKGRIAIPFQYRDQISPKAVICRDVYCKNCLRLYPEDAWLKFTEKINALPQADGDTVKRYVYSGSCNVTFDAQERTLIPAKLRKHAQLESSVTFVGMGEVLEIWDTATWDGVDEAFDTDEIAGIAAKYNL